MLPLSYYLKGTDSFQNYFFIFLLFLLIQMLYLALFFQALQAIYFFRSSSQNIRTSCFLFLVDLSQPTMPQSTESTRSMPYFKAKENGLSL